MTLAEDLLEEEKAYRTVLSCVFDLPLEYQRRLCAELLHRLDTSPAPAMDKEQFAARLWDKCRQIKQPNQVRGRPANAISRIVFGLVYKCYSKKSLRVLFSELQTFSFLHPVPSYNSLSGYIFSSKVTDFLREVAISCGCSRGDIEYILVAPREENERLCEVIVRSILSL